ncbi:MAG: hypothetical protein K2G36_03310 [Ruminococcus sp.]|nr:hypothetical protein [Ruminococcus sp.]
MSDRNNFDNFDTSVTGVERVSGKKGKKIAIISGITAVAIIGGGTAVYNLSDFVKNQVNLRIMKPENYYSWVIGENSKNIASDVKEKYAKAKSKTENGQNMSMSLNYAISDEVKDNLITELVGDRNSSSGDENNLISIIDNLSEISIGGNADVKDNSIAGNIFATWNGQNLIDGDIAFNAENYDFFLRVPELTEQWLCMALGDSVNLDDLKGKGNIVSYLTPEELEDIIVRYTDVWNKAVEDVEIEKKEIVDICDISVEYTVISSDFTEADIIAIATDFVTELKNDSTIKRIAVNEMGLCTEDEYNSELDDVLKELSENAPHGNDTVTLNTYIDPNGDIRGIKFIQDDDELFCVMGKDGEKVRGEFYVSENNSKEVSLELYADENNGKYSGNLDIMADNQEVSVEFTDYQVVNEENGYINAGMNFIIPYIDPVHVDFTSDGNSQDISYNINFDGKDYGTLTLNMAVNGASSPSMPSKDGAFIISDAMNSEPELADYIPEDKMKDFVNDILIKIGFTEELAEEGAGFLNMDLYDTNDYEEIYDDFGGFDDDSAFTYEQPVETVEVTTETETEVETEIQVEEETEDSDGVWIQDDEEDIIGEADNSELVEIPQETLPYDSVVNYSHNNSHHDEEEHDTHHDENMMYFEF